VKEKDNCGEEFRTGIRPEFIKNNLLHEAGEIRFARAASYAIYLYWLYISLFDRPKAQQISIARE
jgi:hypothetical protein